MHIRGLLSLVMSVDLKLSVSTWSSGICSLFTGMLLGSVGLHIRDKTNKQKSSNRTLSRMWKWASLDSWWGRAWLLATVTHPELALLIPTGLPSLAQPSSLRLTPAEANLLFVQLFFLWVHPLCYPKDLSPLVSFLSRTFKWPYYSLLTPSRCLWAAQTCPSREKHAHLFPSLTADSGVLDWDCGLGLSNISLDLPSDFHTHNFTKVCSDQGRWCFLTSENPFNSSEGLNVSPPNSYVWIGTSSGTVFRGETFGR